MEITNDTIRYKSRKQTVEDIKNVLMTMPYMMKHELQREEFETCAQLRDIIVPLNKYLTRELEYKDIKQALAFGMMKFEEWMPF